MSAIKKYYRLSELKESFGITGTDVEYLTAETDISFCLYCKTASVILGLWSDGKFYAAGQANYSGLISLSKNEQIKLFEESKVTVTLSKALQKEKITHYSTQNPFGVDMPNTVIEKWFGVSFEQLTAKYILFLFYPDEKKCPKKQIEAAAKQLSAMLEKNTASLVDAIKKQNIEKELFHQWRSFTLNDVCITADELKKAQHYLSGDTVNNKATENGLLEAQPISTNSTLVRESDFNSLIKRILLSDIHISAKGVWAVLKSEVELEANERKFDEYNILKTLIADDLTWESRYGNSGSQSFSSINTTVSRNRKKLKTV